MDIPDRLRTLMSTPTSSSPTVPVADSAMSNTLPSTSSAAQRVRRVAGRLLRLVLTLFLIIYFGVAIGFLVLRFAVMPNVDVYKHRIEQIAGSAVGQPVTVGSVTARWSGLHPRLILSDVVVRDDRGAVALNLPTVDATVSWLSVPAAELRLYQLIIDRPDLDIARDAAGKIRVGGIAIDPNKPGKSNAADWLLQQQEIVIRNGRLHWLDQQRGAPELVLQQVDLRLQNNWRDHKFSLTAVPPAALSAPIDVRAHFEHPRFATHPADARQWLGELFADIHDTDLGAWKAYVDYPFELKRGVGSVRAWLKLDRARIVDFTADLNLAHIESRLRTDLLPLNLAQVSGRLSIRETIAPLAATGTPTLGTLGYRVGLANFAMRTEDGVQLPTTTLSQSYQPSVGSQPEKIELNADQLDLATLASLVERLPLPIAPRQMLTDFAPRGQLKNFSASWQGTYPVISSYAVRGQFFGLSLNAQPPRAARPKTATNPAQAAVPAIPGFENLTGAIDASEKGGGLSLTSHHLTFRLPTYLSDPVVPFEKLAMRARWSFPTGDQILLQVDQLDFMQDGLQVALSGKHLIPLTPGGGRLGDIDVNAKITEFALNKLDRYLPLQTPTRLRSWLVGALRQGQARDVAIHLKGDLAKFPFEPTKAGAAPSGEFTVNAKLVDATLDYTPGQLAKDGKSPLWPAAENINGKLVLDRTRLSVHADSAISQQVAMTNVNAIIPDLLSSDKQLQIDGTAIGALQNLVRYINASPVADWIGHFTDETRASGAARLNLKMRMPLDHVADTQVTGALEFMNNDVVLQNAIPPLTQTSGKLEFNEKGFALTGIKVGFIGAGATISGGSQRDGTIVVKADGGMSVDGLRKTYPSPALQRLLQKMSGGTRYSSTITIKKRRTEVVLESTLQGLDLNFPVPLRKPGNDSLPFRFEMASLPSDDPRLLRDEIKVALGTTFVAHYLRSRSSERSTPWQVVRGGIGVNAPTPEPDEGLNINVALRSLNIDAWRAVIATIAGAEKARGPVADSAGDGPNLAMYIEPDVMAAQATELIVGNKKIDNVVVGMSHQKDRWQANIDSAQASGYVSWIEGANGRGLGKVTARLASLTIPQSAAAEVSELLENKNNSVQMPALDIVAEDFHLFGKPFGRLELAANNAVLPSGTEWRISKLAINNPDVALNATGKLSSKAGSSVSNLVYSLAIGDAGKLLERFGFANVLRGGKGKMNGDLTWRGLPFALDIPSLTGQIQLDLAAGQFLKVDPGAAKLLGVLSMQALPRRLSLDFRDVFSEGFAFDGITANAAIASGVAKTNNFKMRSVNATVLLDGAIDIAAETQNLHVVVLPEINVGAASVVYALAVNPVIGLGSFLAQLFLREPLMRAFTFEYGITGPWKDPSVKKLDRNTGRPEVKPKPSDTQSNNANQNG